MSIYRHKRSGNTGGLVVNLEIFLIIVLWWCCTAVIGDTNRGDDCVVTCKMANAEKIRASQDWLHII
jgi:hypothetical protein